jgi:hypothetical protein
MAFLNFDVYFAMRSAAPATWVPPRMCAMRLFVMRPASDASSSSSIFDVASSARTGLSLPSLMEPETNP